MSHEDLEHADSDEVVELVKHLCRRVVAGCRNSPIFRENFPIEIDLDWVVWLLHEDGYITRKREPEDDE